MESPSITDLPDGWTAVPLRDVCELRKEQVNPAQCGAKVYVGLEHIESGNSALKSHGSPSDVRSAKSRFATGDLLYGKLRPYLDKAVFADREGICSTDILVLQPKRQQAEGRFLINILHMPQFVQHAIRTTHGVNHPRTSWQSIAEYILALPPLDEQRAIAGVLGKLRAAVAAQQAILDRATELKAALMAKLLTEGTRGEPTQTQAISTGWHDAQLAAIADVFSGHSPKGESYNTHGDGVPLINGPAEFGPRFPQVFKWTTAPKRRCKKGDILFCVRGNTTGRMNEADQEYCIGRGVAAIRGKDGKATTRFVHHLLTFIAPAILTAATSGGSTFPNITDSQLKAWPVSVPPISGQSVIASILDLVDERISVAELCKARYAELFAALLDELMTGRVRVHDLDLAEAAVAPRGEPDDLLIRGE